jgi:hypothetical protein
MASNQIAENPAPQSVGTGVLNPDQFILEELLLYTANDVTDIKNMMVELSYYEDIINGFCSGSVLIKDAIKMIPNLGMSGFEYIKVNFRKTQRNSSKFVSVNKYFRIYRVSERGIVNYDTELYTLNFCTEEFFLSQQLKVSKSYPGKKISDIVTDILFNELQIKSEYIRVQETNGLYDFVIPYKNPYETIKWLSNYARPIGKEGADFLFYENADGVNFFSLQTIFKQQSYNKFSYIPRNIGTDYPEIQRNITGIKSYVFLDTFDSLYGVTKGVFANKLISVDPLTGTWRQTDFNLNDYLKKSQNLNNYSIAPQIKNRKRKPVYEEYSSVLKIATGNSRQKFAQGINPSSVANDIYIEEYLPKRTAQLPLSHYSRIKLSLAGDPNITVGMIIEVFLPSTERDGLTKGVLDEYNSGKYMVSAVRHILDSNQKYETVVEVVKDTYNKTVNNYRTYKQLEDAIRG